MKFIIRAAPRTKKNSQNIYKNKKTGKYFISPSNQYKIFAEQCKWLVPIGVRNLLSEPVNIKAIFYVDSRRKVDLTNLLEAIDDILVETNVIKDDCRDIIAGHDGSRVYYDKEKPRIEVEITKMEGYEQWTKKK